ncbi:Dabb family protein [Leucobacter albus]|uniref:Dabb family protein n=1 Tax=Leucobacter albus TaxID=272210 RepID=A0ABW3TP39_9MICO
MAVRHIVSWKMNGETAAERAAQAREVVEALTPLRDIVPGVLALNVYPNGFDTDGNWDVVLVSDHEDKAALDAYAINPDHVAAAGVVKARAAARSAVDFQL